MSNSTIDYNKQIDGLRCIAVLGVLVCHFIRFDNPYLSRFPFGFGVNLFFVISGYLITKILLTNKVHIERKKITLKKALLVFYYRRTLRIFPIYYLTIFFLFIINFQNTREVFHWLVSYTSNFYISFDYPYIGSFNHLWSLAVEEQFYLIWPMFIFIVPQKYIGKAIIGIITLSLAFKIFYFACFGASGAINALTISCADSLGFGALIAYWSLRKPKLLSKICNIRYTVLITFLLFCFFIVFPRPSEPFVIVAGNFFFSIFAFFVVLKASQMKFNSVAKYILENSLMIHVGKISYGIYLYHLFMPDFYNQMAVFFPTVFTPQSLIRIPFLFITAILFAELSWWILERQILKLKDRVKY